MNEHPQPDNTADGAPDLVPRLAVGDHWTAHLQGSDDPEPHYLFRIVAETVDLDGPAWIGIKCDWLEGLPFVDPDGGPLLAWVFDASGRGYCGGDYGGFRLAVWLGPTLTPEILQRYTDTD